MSISLKLQLNEIKFSAEDIIVSMLPWIKLALDNAEEALIEEMKSEIDLVSGAPHEWRDLLKSHLKHIREEVTNKMITYFVGPGYPDDPENGLWMRAMVVAFGNEAPIYAGPLGAEVWDEDLLNRKSSEVPYKRPIPKTWYHEGRNYIENSISNIRARYEDLLLEAIDCMPSTVFSNSISVTPKGVITL